MRPRHPSLGESAVNQALMPANDRSLNGLLER